MEGAEFLSAIAQIAVGLIGITSFVVAIRRTNRPLRPQDFVGIRLILELSFGAVFFALLPFLLYFSFMDLVIAWSYSSMAMCIFMALYIFVSLHRVNILSSRNAHPRRPKTVFFAHLIMLFFSGIQLFNFLLWNNIGIYMTGLLWLVAATGLQLYFFVSFYELQE